MAKLLGLVRLVVGMSRYGISGPFSLVRRRYPSIRGDSIIRDIEWFFFKRIMVGAVYGKLGKPASKPAKVEPSAFQSAIGH